MVPIAFIHTKNAQHLKREVCNYTKEGRKLIHKPLGVKLSILRKLMEEEIEDMSIAFMDNRISLYVAQHGKCAILGTELRKEDICCYHRKPISQGGTDRYENLIIVHRELITLLQSLDQNIIAMELAKLNITEVQLKKINKIRKSANIATI